MSSSIGSMFSFCGEEDSSVRDGSDQMSGHL